MYGFDQGKRTIERYRPQFANAKCTQGHLRKGIECRPQCIIDEPYFCGEVRVASKLVLYVLTTVAYGSRKPFDKVSLTAEERECDMQQ